MKKDMIYGIILLSLIVTASLYIPYFDIFAIIAISALYYHDIESKNNE
jgi:hypothetical protein